MPSRRPLPALALVMPRPELPAGSSPCTPRANTPSTPVLFPKQIMPSPRTSMDSWGSSSGHPDEEVQWEWKSEQVSLLTRTLEALPGHLYTPFNGAVPPSNLLDRIAKSVVQAQGALDWPHSIRQTRFKLIEIARGLNKENVHTTIDEADEEESGGPQATSSVTRRPLTRRAKEKNSATVSRLSNRLQRMDRLIPMYHPYARPGSRSPSPPATNLKETYPFPSIAAISASTGMMTRRHSSLKPAFPPLRRSLSTLSNPLSDVSMASSGSGSKAIPVKRSDSFTAASVPPPAGMKRAPSYGSMSSGSQVDVERKSNAKNNKEDELLGLELNMVSLKGKRPRRSSATSSSGGSSSPERKKKKREEDGKEKLKESPTATKVKVKPKARAVVTATPAPASSPSSAISTRTRTRSSSSVLKPTVSSAAKQATSNTDPNCAISTRTRVPRSPKTSTSAASPTTSPKSSSKSRSRSKSPQTQANETSPSMSVDTVTRSPTPVPVRISETKSAPSTLACRAKSTRTRITRSNSMFGAELPRPQAPVVLPTSTTKSKF